MDFKTIINLSKFVFSYSACVLQCNKTIPFSRHFKMIKQASVKYSLIVPELIVGETLSVSWTSVVLVTIEKNRIVVQILGSFLVLSGCSVFFRISHRTCCSDFGFLRPHPLSFCLDALRFLPFSHKLSQWNKTIPFSRHLKIPKLGSVKYSLIVPELMVGETLSVSCFSNSI